VLILNISLQINSLLSIYKIGLVNNEYYRLVVDYYEKRYKDSTHHKNRTLIRSDIIGCMKALFDFYKDNELKDKAKALIDMETDEKYKKKICGNTEKVWLTACDNMLFRIECAFCDWEVIYGKGETSQKNIHNVDCGHPSIYFNLYY
jgi:hypothetical protein